MRTDPRTVRIRFGVYADGGHCERNEKRQSSVASDVLAYLHTYRYITYTYIEKKIYIYIFIYLFIYLFTYVCYLLYKCIFTHLFVYFFLFQGRTPGAGARFGQRAHGTLSGAPRSARWRGMGLSRDHDLGRCGPAHNFERFQIPKRTTGLGSEKDLLP